MPLFRIIFPKICQGAFRFSDFIYFVESIQIGDCRRIDFNFGHMIETAVILWESDPDFIPKLKAQPYFCLPHYRAFIAQARRSMNKKTFASFWEQVSGIENAYLEKLGGDVSWFCKKFDYRYNDEPWYDSKDAVERAMKFLSGDLHKDPKKVQS